jgi:hypothetical protein
MMGEIIPYPRNKTSQEGHAENKEFPFKEKFLIEDKPE